MLNDITPPKSHDLLYLCSLCSESESKFNNFVDDCAILTQYGVHARYPFEIEITQSDMKKAIESSNKIYAFVANLLPEILEKVKEKLES